MLALLSTALLGAVALMVGATVLVLTMPARPHRPPLPTTVTSAAVAGVLVASTALVLGAVLGAGATRTLVVAVLLGGSLLAWVPATRAWDVRGLAAWALGVDVVIGYLAYVAAWTLQAGLGPWWLLAGWALWLVEAVVLLVGLVYLWDVLDGLSQHHRHRGRNAYTRGRAVRAGGVVLVTGAVAVGTFVAFASPVGGPDLGSLPRELVQQTHATQAARLTAGHTLVRASARSRSSAHTPTPVHAGTAAVPTSASAARNPTGWPPLTVTPGSPPGPPPPVTHATSSTSSATTSPTAPTSTTQPTRAPSTSPTATTPPAPGPTSNPPSSEPTQTPSTGHTHPTHPSHPTHATHPTRPTGRPTPGSSSCGSGC